MADQMPHRAVSARPGTTEYTEVFWRVLYPDGTIMDSEPRRLDQKAPMLFPGPSALGATAVRMQRTVTVTATEWVEAPAEAAAKTTDVSPAYEPNDYCQRTACGHAHGFHRAADDTGNRTEDVHSGMCTRCDNPAKCRSFVGKAVKA